MHFPSCTPLHPLASITAATNLTCSSQLSNPTSIAVMCMHWRRCTASNMPTRKHAHAHQGLQAAAVNHIYSSATGSYCLQLNPHASRQHLADQTRAGQHHAHPQPPNHLTPSTFFSFRSPPQQSYPTHAVQTCPLTLEDILILNPSIPAPMPGHQSATTPPIALAS